MVNIVLQVKLQIRMHNIFQFRLKALYNSLTKLNYYQTRNFQRFLTIFVEMFCFSLVNSFLNSEIIAPKCSLIAVT